MKEATPQLLLAHRNWRWLLIAGSIFWLAVMWLLHAQSFVSVGDITRDPAAIAEHPPYFGALSNLSILLWSASAAVCFLSGALLKVLQPISQHTSRPISHAQVPAHRQLWLTDAPAFFTTFAYLNALLCLDDTYLLHEAILPNRLPVIHIPEKVVVLMYAAALLAAIVRFWPLLKRTQLWLFGLCLLLFLTAAGLDQVIPKRLEFAETTFLVEDGCKLLGVFLWLGYFCRTSLDWVTRAVMQHD